MLNIVERLAKDECIIGKVPNVAAMDADFYENLFEAETKDGPVDWEKFREVLCARIPWKMMDREALEEIVNEFFALSYKYKMQGKDNESKDMATKALRL